MSESVSGSDWISAAEFHRAPHSPLNRVPVAGAPTGRTVLVTDGTGAPGDITNLFRGFERKVIA